MGLKEWIKRRNLRHSAKVVGKHTAKGLGEVGKVAAGGARGLAKEAQEEMAFRRKLRRKRMEAEIPYKLRRKYGVKKTKKRKKPVETGWDIW